jgi:hypothetical protein
MITRSCDGIRIIDVIRDIYLKSGDGIRAFYKGYLVTLGTSLPFNSIIWTIYWKVQSRLERSIIISNCCSFNIVINPTHRCAKDSFTGCTEKTITFKNIYNSYSRKRF